MDRHERGSVSGAQAAAEAALVLAAHRSCRDVEFDSRQTVDPSRVLIVDTNVARSAVTASLVHSVGRFETRSAYSAEVALMIADDFLPGFVLISTDLPDLSSYRLASVLHQRPGLFESRLIALTSEIISVDRRVAFSAGFEQYLTLPLEQAALERVLLCRSHRGLARGRSRQELARPKIPSWRYRG